MLNPELVCEKLKNKVSLKSRISQSKSTCVRISSNVHAGAVQVFVENRQEIPLRTKRKSEVWWDPEWDCSWWGSERNRTALHLFLSCCWVCEVQVFRLHGSDWAPVTSWSRLRLLPASSTWPGTGSSEGTGGFYHRLNLPQVTALVSAVTFQRFISPPAAVHPAIALPQHWSKWGCLESISEPRSTPG